MLCFIHIFTFCVSSFYILISKMIEYIYSFIFEIRM